jgi:uncharacterized protein DUF2630
MPGKQHDHPITKHIEQLVNEEHALRDQGALSDSDRQRLTNIQVELDQCWDLLRQRRALREFGKDAKQAHVRPAGVVEDYEQ